MSNAEKLKVLNANRELINAYAELKNIAITTGDKSVLKALKMLDKTTEILSEI